MRIFSQLCEMICALMCSQTPLERRCRPRRWCSVQTLAAFHWHRCVTTQWCHDYAFDAFCRANAQARPSLYCIGAGMCSVLAEKAMQSIWAMFSHSHNFGVRLSAETRYVASIHWFCAIAFFTTCTTCTLHVDPGVHRFHISETVQAVLLGKLMSSSSHSC